MARRFLENPDQLAEAFARVWFKLTHLDTARSSATSDRWFPGRRCAGRTRSPPWTTSSSGRRTSPRSRAGSSPPGCRSPSSSRPRGRRPRRSASATSGAGRTARASASSRSGAGRSTPPTRWHRCCAPWRGPGVLQRLPGLPGRDKKISLADLIVLGGAAAVEQAARTAGHDVRVPFTRDARTPRRSGPMRSPSPRSSLAADGFRNYRGKGDRLPSEHLLVDRANLLNLSAPEMTVLVGGLRVLGANHRQSPLGVFTSAPGSLTNDFFVNLLDTGTEWKPTSAAAETFEGRDRATGETRWTGSRVDLVFGSNSELRAVAEVYASDDARESSCGTSSPRGTRS
ncbi:peroxidase family protein [Streptomyces sp. INA 01156]